MSKFKCPICSTFLESFLQYPGVFFCRDGGCGVWFKKDVIQNYDTSENQLPEVVAQAPAKSKSLNVASICPACRKAELFRRSYFGDEALMVNQCFECSGFWIDVNTMQRIRARYRSTAEARTDQTNRANAAVSSAKVALVKGEMNIWEDYWKWVESQNTLKGD